MTIGLPPVVGYNDVSNFAAEVSQMASGTGFMLIVDPIVGRGQHEQIHRSIEPRVKLLVRVAAHASYQLGTRVYKVAGLDHRWGRPAGVRAEYATTAAICNYLAVLARGGMASLRTLESWAFEPELIFPPTYANSIRGIQRALGLFTAFDAGSVERISVLDLSTLHTAVENGYDDLMTELSDDGRAFSPVAHMLRASRSSGTQLGGAFRRQTNAMIVSPRSPDDFVYARELAGLHTPTLIEIASYDVPASLKQLSTTTPLVLEIAAGQSKALVGDAIDLVGSSAFNLAGLTLHLSADNEIWNAFELAIHAIDCIASGRTSNDDAKVQSVEPSDC